MPRSLPTRSIRARLAFATALFATQLPGPLADLAGEARSAPAERPSFVVVMTDDQRWDTLWSMPFVNGRLRRESVEFPYTYVTTPTCCPSRASFLAGGYLAQDTGVLTNSSPNGGVGAFDDTRTLPVKLQRAGYRTALIGKYLNGYYDIAPYVPPGWDLFVATLTGENFLDFGIVRGTSGPETSAWGAIEEHSGYITGFQIDEAISFVDAAGTEPFLLLLALNAPHPPATPAPEDADAFSDFLYRGRGWGEVKLGDKPLWVQRRAETFSDERAAADEFHRDQLRSLQAVDRGLRALWSSLESSGKLDSTVWMFTSDNGYLWGEHKLFGKALPYEEAVRVPLLVRLPGGTERVDPHVVAMNLDLPATIYDLSGLYPRDKQRSRHSDGASLAPILNEERVRDWRQELLIESYGNVFAMLLDLDEPELGRDVPWRWKFIDYDASGVEAYDGESDFFELDNANYDRAFRNNVRPGLRERLDRLKGLVILSGNLPSAAAGAPYDEELPAWGGKPPYTWEFVAVAPPGGTDGEDGEDGEEGGQLVAGAMPDGLLVTPRGRVAGIATTPGDYRFLVRVTDSSIGRYSGKPQTYLREMTLTVR